MTSRRKPSKLSDPDVPASIGRRDAAREAVLIEVEAPVRNAGKPMGVQIDQPGRDDLTGHRNGPLGFGRIDVPGDRRNPAAGDRHVGKRVEGLRWVDDPSSLEKELVLFVLGSDQTRAGHLPTRSGANPRS